MADLIRTYTEEFPALRFIGKRYTDADRVGGTFADKWGEWFSKGWFTPLDDLASNDVDNGYVGLEIVPADRRYWDYWIGCFTPADTLVPEGYSYIDLPASKVGITWVKGREDDGLYCKYDDAREAQIEAGLGQPRLTDKNETIAFERYNCPRFTDADTQQNRILDLGFYLV